MTREELKEIICKIIKQMGEQPLKKDANAPAPACFWGDNCDATTFYGIGEEA
ncbi:MAG: hypothetical protein V1754_02205 [Pseudomonadota bacterium]